MMLTMLIFGRGHGMSQPHFDGVFYWLTDSLGSQARFYKFMHGLGAQLTSFEWKAPKAGTRRMLSGNEFVVFNTTRSRFRLMHSVSWSAVMLPKELDEANRFIRELEASLGSHP